MGVLLAGLLVDGLGCYAYTLVLFAALPPVAFLLLNLLIFVYLGVFLALALLASTLARNQGVAAAGAFGALIVVLVLGSLPWLSPYSPGKLVEWGVGLMQQSAFSAWPALGVALSMLALSVAAACWSLERQEI